MTRRIAIVLGALCAVLGLVLALTGRGRAPKNRRVLPGVERQRITSVRIERRGQPPIEISETVSRGGVTLGPVEARARSALFDAAELAESRATLERSRPEYGLDPPEVHLVFQPGGATLDLGHVTPDGASVWVRDARGRIHLIDAPFARALSPELDALVDTRVFVFDDTQPLTLQIGAPAALLSLEVAPGGRARLTPPGTPPLVANREAVGVLLRALSDLRFVVDPSVAAAEPTFVIAVPGKRLALVGTWCRPGWLAAALNDVRGCVPGEHLAAIDLIANQDALFSRMLIDVRPDEVRTIALGTMILERRGGGWVSPGTPWQLDVPAVTAWLDRLAAVTAVGLAHAPAQPASNPKLIALTPGPRLALDVVTHTVTRDAEPVRLEITPSDAALFETTALDLRDRQLVATNPTDITEITVEAGGQRTTLVRDPRNAQQYLKGTQVVPNATTLAETLARLRAASFRGASLGRKTRSISFEIEEPTSRQELTITLDRCQAQLAGDPASFQLDQESCTALNAPL